MLQKSREATSGIPHIYVHFVQKCNKKYKNITPHDLSFFFFHVAKLIKRNIGGETQQLSNSHKPASKVVLIKSSTLSKKKVRQLKGGTKKKYKSRSSK